MSRTKIKLCGLSRPCDIQWANELQPDYIGFVFAPQSRRYVSPEKAAELKSLLNPGIRAVGVFVNSQPEAAAELLNRGILDIAQLHGAEDEAWISRLRALTDRPVWQAFRMDTAADAQRAEKSSADLILADSGAGGTGTVFDWSLLKKITRPFILAGGLGPDNVGEAIKALAPYGVDVSSGIETNGVKDKQKMAAFAAAVRKEREQ